MDTRKKHRDPQDGADAAVSLMQRYEFREIRPEEAMEAARIEAVCFPPHEACSEAQMKARIQKAPEMFLVAADRLTGKLVGFLNGLATEETKFRDEFFENAGLHDPSGTCVMLLGLDVLPEYRKQGIARELMDQYAKKEAARGRRLLLLTCLDFRVPMYERMGFLDLGISDSAWGGEQWHEMKRIL